MWAVDGVTRVEQWATISVGDNVIRCRGLGSYRTCPSWSGKVERFGGLISLPSATTPAK